jgi:AAA domain-containing protein
MSEFEFKEAKFENVALLIGLAGGTGSGKTYSAMRLASGMSGGKKFVVVDTENRRSLHYARDFKFDHVQIGEPFRPETYERAIVAADTRGYPVIVVDSMSHEWAGDGGILDWHDEEIERMSRGDADKRDAVSRAAWIAPKLAHKAFVQKLLQVRAHLILCFRAEEKIDQVKQDGRWKFVPMKSPIGLNGWIPVTDKRLPFELTMSFLLTHERPGVPHAIKLEAQHKRLIDLTMPLTEDVGARLAMWARGEIDPLNGTVTIDQLIESYGKCRTLADFDVLEAARKALWSQIPRGDKEQLSFASKEAKARIEINQSKSPTTGLPVITSAVQVNEQGLAAIRDSKNAADAEAAYHRFSQALVAVGGDTLELEGALNDRLAAIKFEQEKL